MSVGNFTIVKLENEGYINHLAGKILEFELKDWEIRILRDI